MPDPVAYLNAALEGRYAVERELGAGGMATVYLARDLKHGRQVALKVLRPEIAQSIGTDRFLREIEIAARLRHPHILPLYDSGTAGDTFFYVMPLAEGESLRDRITREKQLPVDEALRLAREIADALAYAHTQGVVHRDIKPENILVESGHAVVADFGIARVLGSAGAVQLTESGLAIGTPTYMSPEQASGAGDVDGRSDLYSLACLTYEMLAGSPPFTGPTVESVVRQHMTVDPRPVDEIRGTVPARIAAALTRALAKNPADRFATAAAFGSVLEATEEAAAAVRPAAPRLRPAWAVVGGLAVAIAAVGSWWVAGRGTGEGAGAVRERAWLLVAEFDGSADDAERRMAREFVRTALDQSATVMTVPDEDMRRGLSLMDRPDTTRVDADLARELAVRSSIRAVVTGQIDRVGNTYAVLLRVLDADSNQAIVAERAIADDPDDLISTIDETVRSVRELLGEQRVAVRANRHLYEVMTSSFEAYRKFVEASIEMQTRGRQGRTVELLREALAIDPEFASARLAMFPRFMNFGMRDSALVAVQEALALAHRLTDAERLKAEAGIAFTAGDLDDARNRYRELAERYQEAGAYTNWGLQEAQMGRTEAALEIYRRAPAPFGPHPTNLWNQSEALLGLGRVAELDSVIELMPENWRDERRLAGTIVARRFDEAERMMEAWIAEDPPADTRSAMWVAAERAPLDALRGRVERAASAIDALTTWGREREWRAQTMSSWESVGLALAVASGRTVPPSRFTADDTSAVAQAFHGVAAGLAGDTTAAEAAAAALEARGPAVEPEIGRVVPVVRAAAAAGAGDWERVREQLAPAGRWNWPYRSFRGPPIASTVWLLLAEAYERTGAPDSAVTYLALLTDPGELNRADGDYRRAALVHAFAQFRLARVLTTLDRVAEARAAWIAFLDTFTDPDPEYEWMVTEARAKLEELARGR